MLGALGKQLAFTRRMCCVRFTDRVPNNTLASGFWLWPCEGWMKSSTLFEGAKHKSMVGLYSRELRISGYQGVQGFPRNTKNSCVNMSTTARWQNGKCASLQNSF